jgi:hypothetical protein
MTPIDNRLYSTMQGRSPGRSMSLTAGAADIRGGVWERESAREPAT